MATRGRRLLLVLAVLAGALLGAACGDTLIDSKNEAVRDQGKPPPDGGGFVCRDDQLICGTDCVTQSAGTACGGASRGAEACTPCPAAPANATATCTVTGKNDGACGFDCDPGLLETADACVAPALVAAGKGFSCATAAGTGEVHCWGANDQGQLGDGTTNGRATAAKVPGLSGVTALAAGQSHACALAGSTVSCWGNGAAFGASGAVTQPTVVTALAGVTTLTAGAGHTCGISGGAVKCAGAGLASGGGSPGLAGAIELAAGDAFTCALLSGGTIRCWGDNSLGQLGVGNSAPGPATVAFAAAGTVQHIAAGATHACASDDSTAQPVWCWGDGSSSQLGTDGTAGANAPVNNARIKKPVTGVLAGGVVSCALVQDAAPVLRCWSSDFVAIGAPSTAVAGEPFDVLPSPGEVAVGAGHLCFVDPASRLRCLGHGAEGQLGNGATQDTASGASVLVVDR